MPLAAHGVTHPGRRKTNEDALLVDVELGLFVVADGMGGHNAGEVASAIAVSTLRDFFCAQGERTQHALADGLCHANDEVLAASDRPEYAGMGTTVVAACVTDDQVMFGSVGDSRIYLWRNRRLTQLTQDDSWVSHVLRQEDLSEDDLQRHPMRHVLTKVVGLRADMEPSIGVSAFGPGDALLLCSDGLHGSVPDPAIAELLVADGVIEATAQRLVDQALSRGATDNITVVIVRREEPQDGSSSRNPPRTAK
jgi:serine/threonine protein phosphatase PrpC